MKREETVCTDGWLPAASWRCRLLLREAQHHLALAEPDFPRVDLGLRVVQERVRGRDEALAGLDVDLVLCGAEVRGVFFTVVVAQGPEGVEGHPSLLEGFFAMLAAPFGDGALGKDAVGAHCCGAELR